MKQYQVTLYCATGQYKPVSCIVTVAENTEKKDIITKGIIKICQKRLWQNTDLKKYHYTQCKIREWNGAE